MIFVTGGTGLVGSHLMYDLLLKGYNVVALKRRNSDTGHVKKIFSYYSSKAEELYMKIKWAEGDLLDIYSLEDALAGIDFVYHCAGYVSFDPRERKKVIRINEEGTANLVNAALFKGIKKFCHVSSIAALGRSAPEEHINEDSKWKTSRKNSVYAISKFNSEREVWRGTEEGLKSVIVNPSVILGPSKWDTGSSRLITTVYKGQRFYTTGINGFVDVRDVSRAMVMLMESDIVSERYVLNSGNISYKQLLFNIAEELGVKRPSIKAGPVLSGLAWRLDKIRSILTGTAPFITKETASSAIGKYYYSSKKIEKELGFTFISVQESIRNAVRCFLKDIHSERIIK